MTKLRILDGGMSRELLRLGAELKQPEWSALALIDCPDIVRQVHGEFIEPVLMSSPPIPMRWCLSTLAKSVSRRKGLR
jgi:hypothetical protein